MAWLTRLCQLLLGGSNGSVVVTDPSSCVDTASQALAPAAPSSPIKAKLDDPIWADYQRSVNERKQKETEAFRKLDKVHDRLDDLLRKKKANDNS